MNRAFAVLAAAAFTASLAGAAYAAPCKDAKGKFMKCPTVATATAVHCMDPKTKKFAKCTAPGAVPMAAKAK